MDTKLHTSVRYGHLNAVLEALKDGLNPNQIGMFKWSAVHEAANNGERDILKLLITSKGDVNLQDKLHGNTPLHYAAREDNSACVTVLLKAGARIDIINFAGMTCLDEATQLCREIIHEFVNGRNAGSEWTGGKNELFDNRNMNVNGGVHCQNGGDHLPAVPEQAAIGQLHLSFEYQKADLKIRVWQISDLLLPPPQISMIDSIFVRSYFIPDTAKKTNRHTECVRVESQSKDSTLSPQNGIQHIFSPSSFRFENPLMYTGMTQKIVDERSVQLEVCMTQKYTHKPFLMAMVHLPLRTAVKHPIREKYPLIPCMNHTIPNNMRVYSARDIMFDKSSLYLNRSPTRSNSSQSNVSCPLTLKDAYSDDVEVGRFMVRSAVDLSDSDCDDGVGSSFDVKSSLGKSRTSSAATVDVISLGVDNDDIPGDLGEGLGPQKTFSESTSGRSYTETTGGRSEENFKPKKKIIPNELLFDRTSGLDKNFSNVLRDDDRQLSVIKIDEEVNQTLIKNMILQNSSAVSLELKPTKEDSKREQGPINGKKKIIPPELSASIDSRTSLEPNHESNHGVVARELVSNGNFSDGNKIENKDSISASDVTHQEMDELVHQAKSSSHNHQKCSESSEDQECDVVSKVGQSQHNLSVDGADTGPSSATVSRPETPIWDFYDFTLEEGAEQAGDGQEVKDGSLKDDASSALGTLQESIMRLSRSSKALDTCRVTGPVLPNVVMDDFEMDNDDDDDEEEENDDEEEEEEEEEENNDDADKC